jgi:hypothetical protein
MTKDPIHVTDRTAIDELRRQLAQDTEFAGEDAVYEYDSTLSVYESLLVKATNVRLRAQRMGGLKKLLQFLADGIPLKDGAREAALGVGRHIDAIHETISEYFGKWIFKGDIKDAEGNRREIVAALIMVADALESLDSTR